MDMIAMLAGLGQAEMTPEERAAMVRAEERAQMQAAEDRAAMLKTLGVFAAGALAGWFFRGQTGR